MKENGNYSGRIKGFFILDAVKNDCGAVQARGPEFKLQCAHKIWTRWHTFINPALWGWRQADPGAHWPDSLTVMMNSWLLRDLVSKSNGESSRVRHLVSIYGLHIYIHRQTCKHAHIHTIHTPYRQKKVRKKNIFWLMERGQNISINRCLEAVDSSPHGWLRGSNTIEKSYPCNGVSKRAWIEVGEVAQWQGTRLAHRSWV